MNSMGISCIGSHPPARTGVSGSSCYFSPGRPPARPGERRPAHPIVSRVSAAAPVYSLRTAHELARCMSVLSVYMCNSCQMPMSLRSLAGHWYEGLSSALAPLVTIAHRRARVEDRIEGRIAGRHSPGPKRDRNEDRLVGRIVDRLVLSSVFPYSRPKSPCNHFGPNSGAAGLLFQRKAQIISVHKSVPVWPVNSPPPPRDSVLKMG